MSKNDLLKAKATAKAKLPSFQRTDAHKKKRIKKSWRKPNGIQNKMRLHHKSFRVMVEAGYGTPAVLRHTTRQGLSIVKVSTLAELSALDTKKEAALLSNVGRRKKEELIKAANEKGITLVNLSAEKYTEKTKSIAAQRAKDKEERKAETEKKKADAQKREKAAKKKEEKAEAQSQAEDSEDAAEAHREQEKAEKDKVLTSKKGM